MGFRAAPPKILMLLVFFVWRMHPVWLDIPQVFTTRERQIV
jgi:hypothetical protein